MHFSFSLTNFLASGVLLIVFILVSYAGMFVREKAGWIIAVMAGVIFAGFIKVFVPAQHVWPAAGCYFVIIAILRVYSLSSVERGRRFNFWLTAILDKIFIFFSGVSLTERAQKLKEFGEKKQAEIEKAKEIKEE
jgi:hypothetical protein